MPCWDNLQLCCGVCRICVYSVFKCLCCKKSVPPKMEYSVVCIGLTNAGKTTILSVLCNESTDDITPTTGFIIKPCLFTDCILNIKEIGGGERQRPYWRHYYHDSRAVVYVVDAASSPEEMSVSKDALHEAVGHPDLDGLPLLLLANCCDKTESRTIEQVKQDLDLEAVSHSRPCEVYLCSALKEPNAVRTCFETFIDNHLAAHRHQPIGQLA